MDALPPDPYAALGVAKDATAAAIKAQYRKLVLKHHPDKVQDESQKQSAADRFHKVQTAYEIVGDDERRQRYDAQCKLAELRRDIEREGGVSRGYGPPPQQRSPTSRAPPESPLRGDYYSSRGGPDYARPVSPHFEERRPSYAEERRPSAYADYFESPRPTSRKEDSYDRSSKRAVPRETHKKSKTSDKKTKESERSSREEKSKRTDQDQRREREKKYAPYVSVEEFPSDESEEYEAAPRRRSDGDSRRARTAMEEARMRSEAEVERPPKYHTQESDARDYMARGGVSTMESPVMERRPSPTRKSSSREHIETIRREGKPTITVRRGSGRPYPSTRDSGRKSSSREEVADMPEETLRRPPTLNKTASSPENIRPPFERRRSNSMEEEYREPPRSTLKRAETMPYPPASIDSRRKEPSKPRAEARNTYPTPETTPEPPSARKFSYGHAYVEDDYQTVYREPTASRQTLTRSPSPIRDAREKSRSSAAAKYTTAPPPPPPANKRTTSRSYDIVTPNGIESAETTYARPAPSRENSSRGPGQLYGEIVTPATTIRSPRPVGPSKFSPPADEIRYSPKPRAEDVKTASGYRARRPSEKPASRNGPPISVR